MKPWLRAAARLLRLLVHLLRGAWELRWRFQHMPLAQRHRRVQDWSARTLAMLGVELVMQGHFPSADEPMLVVANHVSWLDIAALHAVLPQARFVAKSEVGAWPLVGGLCRGVRTLFIERDRKRDAMRVVNDITTALCQGDTVALFPEGTTGDGHALLPFHANLLQAASASGRPVLPVALRFSDPEHAVSPVVAYVGATTLLQSLGQVLRAPRLRATVMACAPLDSRGQDRRDLAQRCQSAIAARLQSLGARPDVSD